MPKTTPEITLPNGRVLVEDAKGRYGWLSFAEVSKKFKIDFMYLVGDEAKPCPFMVKEITGIGYALISLKRYLPGQWVINYLGEKIIDDPNNLDDYAIAPKSHNGKVLSAKKAGGLARFIAHAYHEPLRPGALTANLMPVLSSSNEDAHIDLFATQLIEPGYILAFDYTIAWWRKRAERFPSGPMPLTLEGRPLKYNKMTKEEERIFFIRNDVGFEKAAQVLLTYSPSIVNNLVVKSMSFDSLSSFKKILPEYKWGRDEGGETFICTGPGLKNLQKTIAMSTFWKNIIPDSKLERYAVSPSQVETGINLGRVEGRQQYIEILERINCARPLNSGFVDQSSSVSLLALQKAASDADMTMPVREESADLLRHRLFSADFLRLQEKANIETQKIMSDIAGTKLSRSS